MAGARRESTRSAPCSTNRQKAAVRSPDSRRSPPPTPPPGTCTQPGSPIPTWSSALGLSSASPASCPGRACTPNCTSATPTGPRSARSTSCEHCAATPPGKTSAEPDATPRAVISNDYFNDYWRYDLAANTIGSALFGLPRTRERFASVQDRRDYPGGPWLLKILVPSGLRAVVVPSGCRATVQPH